MPRTILVVDDDPAQRRLLQAGVERAGFVTRTAEDGAQAVAACAAGGVDLVLLDLVMPGLPGMDALKEMRIAHRDLPVIVLTAQAGVETVVQAMQAGAVDFLIKPARPERIVVSIRNALRMSELTTEVGRLTRKATGRFGFEDMIAAAPAMRHVVRLGERAAASSIPVLLLGESGVGKEVVARAIHAGSDRAGRPFVAVNCGALPENLVESILFGHEKGAFTGAHERHAGKFVEANGGTLFLDEIGELPLDVQVKLLRVLQEREVDPVGGRRAVKVDVRIVSATNRELAAQVSEGRFREDLFYRLNVFPLELPPLRERRDDVPALVQRFITRFNAEEGKHVQGALPETMALLVGHDWPGNVRQLENAVFRAVILCDGPFLRPEDFPQISGVQALAGPDPAALQAAQGFASAFVAGPSVLGDDGHLRTLEAIERDLIAFAIETYAGHMSEVARRLGIGRSTLYRKVREHGFDVDRLKLG
jgi:DNA-binding NtrC family response regulator